jgi:hypothetical protein
MSASDMSEVYDEKKLNELLDKLTKVTEMEADAQAELFKLQKSNAEKLYTLRIEQINKEENIKKQKEQAAHERLIKLGMEEARIRAAQELDERLKAIDAEEKDALKGKKGADAKRVKAEYDLKRKNEKALNTQAAKDQEALAKEQDKLDKKRFKEAKKMASETFGNVGDLFVANAAKTQEAIENLMAEGYTKEEAEKAVKGQKMQVAVDAAMKAFDGFAKELEGTMKEVANSRTAIDTRLYGSGQRK